MTKNIVAVNFVDPDSYNKNTKYEYFTEVDLISGDYAIVDTSTSPTTPNFKIVRVIGVLTGDEITLTKATKWIVCKIDMSAYMSRVEREKKLKVLRTKMEGLRKSVEEETLFAMFAEKSPEFAELFSEFKDLKEAK